MTLPLVGVQVAGDAGDAEVGPVVVEAGDGVADGGGCEDLRGVHGGRGPVDDVHRQREAAEPLADDEHLRFDVMAPELGSGLEVVLVDGPGLVDALASRQRPGRFDGPLRLGVRAGADADGLGDVVPGATDGGLGEVVQPVAFGSADLLEGVGDVGVRREQRDLGGGELEGSAVLVELVEPPGQSLGVEVLPASASVPGPGARVRAPGGSVVGPVLLAVRLAVGVGGGTGAGERFVVPLLPQAVDGAKGDVGVGGALLLVGGGDLAELLEGLGELVDDALPHGR
ncbi:hypothetical protein ACNKF0_09275 [Nocardioides sp. T5]|uniref:hypothetical protein n=1 Tax=Nocardioides sp. T5 TaxID=3400182 RepID=UPI003A89078D